MRGMSAWHISVWAMSLVVGAVMLSVTLLLVSVVAKAARRKRTGVFSHLRERDG